MIKLQEKAKKAWAVLSDMENGHCNQDCSDCPQAGEDQHIEGVDITKMKNWLASQGFPDSKPHIHTVTELAKQIIKGRSLPCLTQWIAQYVEAVACPGCAKETLYRERRMECVKCTDPYPADKWATGEPCDCGSMDARYYGIHSANRLGQLEFQRCQTPGCQWSDDYRRLTVQELADAAQVLADEQWAAARTCPACGYASGSDQEGGVYLPIEKCECEWQR